MDAIHAQLDRLAAALTRTSWRCDLGGVAPALVERAEVEMGPFPPEYRALLSRVVVLENHAGDVRFATARELCHRESETRRLLDEWRHADEVAARGAADALAAVRRFWAGAVPFLLSTVEGDDFFALDRRLAPPCVVEARSAAGWSDGARMCATDLSRFLAALATVCEAGAPGLDDGWRLARRTAQQLQQLDPSYREPAIPVFFAADFDSQAPPRCATRPPRALFRK